MISYNRLSIGSHSRLESKDVFDEYTGNFSGIAHMMCTYIWSPIAWQDGVRKKTHFVSCRFCVLDFENPEVSIESIKRIFCDMPHIIATTRNHQKQKGKTPPCDRFRLLLPFERTIFLLDEYEYNMKRIARMYGADENCYDGARLYLQCQQVIEVVEMKDADERMEILLPPSETVTNNNMRRYIEKQERLNAVGRMSSFATKWLTRVMPTGQRNHLCYALGCDLARAGLSAEEAVDRILKSPTYKDMDIGQGLLREIAAAVRSGFHSVKSGKRQDP